MASAGLSCAAPGDLDSSFGSAGTVLTSVGVPTMFDPRLAILPDGRILMSGAQFNGKDGDFVVMRYTKDGVPDASFGSAGMAQIDLYGGNDIAKAIVLQPDGKILLGGETTHRPTAYGVHGLVRLTANGALDSSFGSGGKVSTDFGKSSHIHALALQSDGKIVAAGETYSSADGGAAAIARYNADGSTDTGFGTGGRSEPFSSSANLHAVTVTGDGRILLAGYNTPVSTSPAQCFVARLTANGALDSSFGTGGITQMAVGAGTNHCNAMQIQADGRIVLAGGAQMSSSGNYDFALMRLSADGRLDSTFGSGGIVTTGFSSAPPASNEEGADAILQADGKIVVAGYSNKKFAFARYSASGSLDTAFGSGGKTVFPVGGLDDWVKGLALQADGKILASGFSWNGSHYLMALVRLQNDARKAGTDRNAGARSFLLLD